MGTEKQAEMIWQAQRTIVWFSCGAASAVAAKIMAEKLFGKVELVYCNTIASEHPDNIRFKADVERWVGLPIKTIGNSRYTTIDEVFERERYMSGIAGARCTVELKKSPGLRISDPTTAMFLVSRQMRVSASLNLSKIILS